jgi:site-specific recombinase
MEFPFFLLRLGAAVKKEAADRISYLMQTETDNRAYSSRRAAMGSTFIQWRLAMLAATLSLIYFPDAQQSGPVETMVLRTVSYCTTDCAALKGMIVFVLTARGNGASCQL